MNDLVSVILPVFNRSSTVGLALDSVLKQTYQYWEVLVIDDGSTDDTFQVVEDYARKDSRIRLMRHDQRKGAQAARNAGIRAANGKWITFLDSDDQLLPDSLAVRLQLAMQDGLSVVHSDCYVLKPEKAEPQRLCFPPIQGWVYKELLRRPVTTGYFLFSKEVFTHIGSLDESLVAWQDWDIAIRLAQHYEFGFVHEPTFIWDCRHTDAISKDLLRTAIGYEQVFTKHRRSILRYLGPKALASHYQVAAFFYREANYKSKANLYLLIAILLWPFRARAIARRAQRLLGWQFMK